MARRYSQEFRDRTVRLFADSRVNYTSEIKALESVAKSLRSRCAGGRNVLIRRIRRVLVSRRN
jgi:hypothetical protein